MAKNRTRANLSLEEKLYKATQALFILQARQLNVGNEAIREILGVDKTEINSIAKLINKAIRKHGKDAPQRNS
jgi:hypothetical protein